MDKIELFLIAGTVLGLIACFLPESPKCNKEIGVCTCKSDDERSECEVWK